YLGELPAFPTRRSSDLLVSARQVGIDFQVATAGGVENDTVFTTLTDKATDMGQGCTLGLPGIIEQAARCLDGQCQTITAEAGQVPGLELLSEQTFRSFLFKVPGSLAANALNLGNEFTVGEVVADQKFCRT